MVPLCIVSSIGGIISLTRRRTCLVAILDVMQMQRKRVERFNCVISRLGEPHKMVFIARRHLGTTSPTAPSAKTSNPTTPPPDIASQFNNDLGSRQSCKVTVTDPPFYVSISGILHSQKRTLAMFCYIRTIRIQQKESRRRREE